MPGNYYYARYLKKVDPKKGYFLEYYDTQWPDILDRARLILKSRNKTQILKAAKRLDEVIALEGQALQWEHLQNASKDGVNEDQACPGSPAQELAQLVERADFDPGEALPDGLMEECFAVLALGIAAVAFDDQEQQRQSGANDRAERRSWLLFGHHAVEAMEALAYAESLIMAKRAEQAVRDLEQNRRSGIARSGGVASQEKNRALLKDLVAFYHEKGYQSYAKATMDFLETVDEERVKHLTPTNRNRTLKEKLSLAVRGKISV
jgi:hypothetical protein